MYHSLLTTFIHNKHAQQIKPYTTPIHINIIILMHGTCERACKSATPRQGTSPHCGSLIDPPYRVADMTFCWPECSNFCTGRLYCIQMITNVAHMATNTTVTVCVYVSCLCTMLGSAQLHSSPSGHPWEVHKNKQGLSYLSCWAHRWRDLGVTATTRPAALLWHTMHLWALGPARPGMEGPRVSPVWAPQLAELQSSGLHEQFNELQHSLGFAS